MKPNEKLSNTGLWSWGGFLQIISCEGLAYWGDMIVYGVTVTADDVNSTWVREGLGIFVSQSVTEQCKMPLWGGKKKNS